MAQPLVIVTRRLPDAIETRMVELFDCRLNRVDEIFSQDQLKEAVAEADILVPCVTDDLCQDIIEAAGPGLKMIASFGTGVDHIDLQVCQKKKIIVTNTPGVLTDDTADMAMALILAVSRRMNDGMQRLKSGQWQGWSPTGLLGHRIHGKRLGILGMGRIGTAVARRAKGFGISIHYHNRRPVQEGLEQELEATYWNDLDQMLAHVDIVSVNCPHTTATYHLLCERRLKLLKPTAVLVNTSRSEIIQEDALIQVLKRKKIAGAGLDVFEQEPSINPGLEKLENVVLLPHMGSATFEGRHAMGERVIINMKAFIDGHTPPDRVVEGLL